MANDVTIKDGANQDAVIATRDKAGREVQLVQIDLGNAGTISPAEGTLPVSVASLPLPAGAATGASQDTTNAALGAPADAEATGDGSSIALLKRLRTLLGSLLTTLGGVLTVRGTRSNAGTDVASGASHLTVGGSDGTNLQPLNTDSFGRLRVVINGTPTVVGPLTDGQLRAAAVAVSAAALPLPAGAATEASLATLAGTVKLEDSAGADADPGVVVLAQRRDSDTAATDTDGDYATLKMDEAGRLKVAAQPASSPLVTGSITASAQTVFCNVARSSNIMVHMVATALVGHNSTFEGSIDSTNGIDGAWFAIQAVRSNANTIELTTGVLAATPAYAWELSVNGLAWVRVRATAHTSGTATWKFQPAPYATEPIPAAQISGTQPVSGSVTATLAASAVLAGDVGVQYRANATGAGTPTNINSPAVPVGQTVKGSAGRLLAWRFTNTGAATRWVKFFNATSVTPGTTSAAFEVAIPAAGTVDFQSEGGIGFATGIMTMITAGKGLTNNAGITLDDVTGFTVHA